MRRAWRELTSLIRQAYLALTISRLTAKQHAVQLFECSNGELDRPLLDPSLQQYSHLKQTHQNTSLVMAASKHVIA